MSDISWFVLLVCLAVIVVIYNKVIRRLDQLQQDVTQLQNELQAQKQGARSITVGADVNTDAATTTDVKSDVSSNVKISKNDAEYLATKELFDAVALLSNATIDTAYNEKDHTTQYIHATTSSTIEPDEQSLPIVTSLFNSLKNWFFGGNLVVRVGVLVLLVGVVLLLRLVSEYLETPIELKLAAIAIVGLGLAGLGLKLATKRFAYGITLQGAGLAIAYLTTFFAYDVYKVLASLPSFIALGLLSAVTIALAIRQNAFPLALLALSGGFFAPLLTATDTGSLTMLFSYYLLLNVTIAIIAHYRTWKVLNVFGVAVTFGLAYYFGGFAPTGADIESQRLSLVVLVALHLALYLFIAIRYSQQIIAYNINYENNTAVATPAVSFTDAKPVRSLYLYPMDIGLLFSVPVLAFGLFAALLHDIEHALTITSAVLAVIYLGLGWLLIRRSQRYALITEGMLALGFGFLALIIPLAFDAEWIATGWSIQGLALIWFGRRSLRAWLVLFGLVLQLISISLLFLYTFFSDATTLALSISAIASLASVFILRASNSPSLLMTHQSQAGSHEFATVNNDSATSVDTSVDASVDNISNITEITKYANALGISTQAARQWLLSINSQSSAFNIVWRSPEFISFLTFLAIAWALYVLMIDFDLWFSTWQLATTTLIALATLVSLSIYWLINRYRAWQEISYFSHALLGLFYLVLILQIPQKFEFNYPSTTTSWFVFAILLIGWALVGQLWLKFWYSDGGHNGHDNSHIHAKSNKSKRSSNSLRLFDHTSWLSAGILVLAAAAHYELPDSNGVMAVLIPSVCLIVLMRYAERKFATLLPWFDWHKALVGGSFIFIPLLLIWVVTTNLYHNGVVWNLPYIPMLNLYDIAILLAMAYGLNVYYVFHNRDSLQNSVDSIANNTNSRMNILLKVIGIVGFWVLSSMLVRTLHAYADTPLWTDGAWGNDKVQTSLTILWTLTALIATFISSRSGKRFWWFMGISLLGIVVLKLVLVDLSQTGAIWRVVSFLMAGSMTLLIGYLAPLPPEASKQVEDAKH